MATLIAVFVLVLQNLWLYIDEIMGKGVSFWQISEMLGYMSVSFLPLALPVGILISSVMLFGNLGETYEMASVKSAGISLFRIMLPVIVTGCGLAVFSFYTSNNLIPYTNLKFQTQLYDIRKQKPALNLKEGVYNYDFSGYAIKIKEKSQNGQDLKDILIYDYDNARRNEVTIITAEHGKMYITPSEDYLVMELYNGYQYQEIYESNYNRTYPVMRVQFEKYIKTFDLSEFTFTKTNEALFKNHENMLNVGQLSRMIDTIRTEIVKLKTDNIRPVKLEKNVPKDQEVSDIDKDEARAEATALQIDSFDKETLFYQRFKEKNKSKILTRAISRMRYYNNRSDNLESSIEQHIKKISKYIYQKHNKFSLAVVCIIFLFIGAPMGAIVRKGGFGYPMLIAILFFMLFIVITLFSETMVENARMDAILGAWLPCLILFPIGVFLTIKASNDSKFINIDSLQAFFIKIFTRKAEQE